MTDFLADLQSALDDDSLRLVYADSLEEQGAPRDAEYLRQEVAWVRAEAALTAQQPGWREEEGRLWTFQLSSVGARQKIFAIKLVREFLDLGLREAKTLVEAVAPSSPQVLGTELSRHEAESDLAWLRRVPGIEAQLVAAGALSALLKDWNDRWSRLQALTVGLDAEWLRRINRRWAVVVTAVPEGELGGSTSGVPTVFDRFVRMRPSTRGLLCGTAFQFHTPLPLIMAEGLVRGEAERLRVELEQLDAKVELRRSRCFFDFPAGL